jgi:hypothetical protein
MTKCPFLLTSSFFAAGWLGLKLPFAESYITPIWPPASIAIAVLFRRGCRVSPGICLGAFSVNPAVDSSFPLAFLSTPLFNLGWIVSGITGETLARLGISVFSLGYRYGTRCLYLTRCNMSLFPPWIYMAATVLTGLLITALQTEQLKIERELAISAECLNDTRHLARAGGEKHEGGQLRQG